jgi:hypothetical protein
MERADSDQRSTGGGGECGCRSWEPVEQQTHYPSILSTYSSSLRVPIPRRGDIMRLDTVKCEGVR